jgi:hypothetical protein
MDKAKIRTLLESYNTHSVYYIEPMAARLADCGLDVEVAADRKSLTIGGLRVEVSEPEWGEPGLSPLSILRAIYELDTGSRPESSMSGMGFWYRDVLEQLTKRWKQQGDI